MSSRVNGLTSYLPSGGVAQIIAIKNGSLWSYNGSTATQYSGSLSTTGHARMVQVNDLLYGVDGAGTVFKFDGTTLSTPTILDASSTALTGVKDILHSGGRLWYATQDEIHFSDALTPEVINEASIKIRKGAGDTIRRLVSYRYLYIVIFKTSTSGNGSIHVLDNTSNQPEYMQVTPLFENIALVSPDAVVRAGYDADSDILFPTREGWRSLKFTALDKITTPSPLLSDNINSYWSTLTYNSLDEAWGIIFDDELLYFAPTNGSTTPNKVFAWTFKEQARKEEIRQGWTILDNMPATCGTVAALTGKPLLWLGTNDGYLQKAFQSVGATTTYREKSKRIDFGKPTQDKRLLKLMVVCDRGSSGTLTAKLIREDGVIYSLGGKTFTAGGATLPFTLPFTLGETGIDTFDWDLRYDSAAGQLPRFQDVRVVLDSTGDPKILGFELLAQEEKRRFPQLSDEQGGTFTADNIGGDTITAGNLDMN